MKIIRNKLIVECSAYDFKVELERKKIRDWLRSVSAFANGTGGALYFGVDNNAGIAGLSDPQETADFISQKINAHLDPVPLFSLTPDKTDDGKVIIELMVQAGNQTPYYLFLDGSRMAYIRKGNESVAANAHELYHLVLKGSNRSWDSLVSNEHREKHSFTTLEREYNERSGGKWEESLLLSFGLVADNGMLTYAGLLFADRCPIKRSRVFCTKWAGLHKDDATNDAEFQGNLLENLRSAKSFIKANTAVPWFKLPDYRLNMPEYAERAIEEMCVNHLIHRDYTDSGAEVAINIYDNRIVTTSPGGISDSEKLETLNPDKVASHRRNPILAEVFSQLNYMEKRGSGLRRIQEETAILPTYSNDKKPYFESSNSFFYTTIPNVNYGMKQADFENLVESKKNAQTNRPENSKTAQTNRPENSKTAQTKIRGTAQAIIDILVENPHCSRTDLMSRLGKADGTIKGHLARLQAKGIIKRIGPDFGGYWKVLIR